MRLCETKPDSGALGYLGPGAGEPIVQNKPNSWIADFGLRTQDRLAAGHRLRPADPTPPSRLCKTNPICPAVPRATRPQGHGTRGNRAKQTQFGPGGQLPAGRNARNELNLHPRTRIGGASPTLQGPQLRQTNPIRSGWVTVWTPASRKRAKQSQTWAGWDIWGVGSPGRSQRCKTNPILRLRTADFGLRIQDRPVAGHRLRPAAPTPAGRFRKMNPICPAGPGGRGPGTWNAGRTCKTNPICAAVPRATWPQERGTRGNRAKRTQFRPQGQLPAGRNVRNEPNLHPRRGIGGASPTLPGRRLRQTNPTQPGRTAVRGPARGHVRSKANSSIADCAKRTQFGPAGLPSGSCVRNEADFRPSGRLDGLGIRHRRPAMPPAEPPVDCVGV